jgi:tryptophan-rich sensory protein
LDLGITARFSNGNLIYQNNTHAYSFALPGGAFALTKNVFVDGIKWSPLPVDPLCTYQDSVQIISIVFPAFNSSVHYDPVVSINSLQPVSASQGISYFVSVIISIAIGLGPLYLLKLDTSDWYKDLITPEFLPPSNYIWPLLVLAYTFIGCSLAAFYVVDKKVNNIGQAPVDIGYSLLFIQFSLGWAASFVFLMLHRVGLVTILLAALFSISLINIGVFWEVSPLAGTLMIPFALWMGYSTAVSFMTWRLNADISFTELGQDPNSVNSTASYARQISSFDVDD